MKKRKNIHNIPKRKGGFKISHEEIQKAIDNFLKNGGRITKIESLIPDESYPLCPQQDTGADDFLMGR